jgi:hypothetical protein
MSNNNREKFHKKIKKVRKVGKKKDEDSIMLWIFQKLHKKSKKMQQTKKSNNPKITIQKNVKIKIQKL